jgi:hypothetical protein
LTIFFLLLSLAFELEDVSVKEDSVNAKLGEKLLARLAALVVAGNGLFEAFDGKLLLAQLVSHQMDNAEKPFSERPLNAKVLLLKELGALPNQRDKRRG